MLGIYNVSSNLFDHQTINVCKVRVVRGQYNFRTGRLRRFRMVTPFIPFVIALTVNPVRFPFISSKFKKISAHVFPT